jgi:hypothetical protein
MIVSDADQMDAIVQKNEKLSWDGWNVVHLVKDDYAEFLSVGIFDKKSSQWYRKTIYQCTEMGWNIPESVM